jgi:hypothetical protein
LETAIAPKRTERAALRRWISFGLKLGVTGALLYWAFRSVDLAALRAHFARMDGAWVVAALAALVAQLGVAGWRWSRIASALGSALPPVRSARFSAVAAFFNQVLPSTIGGDAMRVYLLGRRERQWKNAIYSVIVDRIAGVTFLAMLVAACLPWSLERIEAPAGRATIAVIGLAGVLALPMLLLAGAFGPRWRFARWRVVSLAVEVARAACAVLLQPARGAALAAVSLVIHLLTVAAAWFLARSIVPAPDFLGFLILIPPVMLIAMVPVSVGGWGIREGAMVVAFGYAGMEQSQALAISVLMGAAALVIGAAGGLIWLAERGPARADAAHARAEPHA